MSADCIRRAWLVLGTRSLPLEDVGYACTSLDLGYPVPREVTNNRPDMDGIDDRTSLMGARVVTAAVTALVGMGGARTIDELAASFAPFMVPSARPELHYVLERPGNPERVLVLRPSGYSWPIAGASQRDVSLQWTAPDPVARSSVLHSTTAWAGIPGGGGRLYNLTYNRIYPPGAIPTTGQIVSDGDVPVRPVLRVYGPITAPVVAFSYFDGSGSASVPFVKGYAIAAGDWVEVDTDQHAAYFRGDRSRSILSALDWPNLVWPVIPPSGAAMDLAGDPSGLVTSGVTQAQATWLDGYLS